MEKNNIKDSTLDIGGNLNIGDTTIATQQNHSGNGDNVAGDKIGGDKVLGDKITNEYHYYGERKIIRLLTDRPFYTDFFIGRDTDLAAIESAYQQKNHLLMLVNGEGGMGKTTLAAHYWFLHEKRYTHLAWVFADSGVGNALLRLAQPLGITFHPQDDERAQIARITEGVNQLNAPCLLVFDNANQADDLEKHFVTLKKLTNCHILLTSRVTELGDAPVYRVTHLKKADAVQIFKKYYPKHQDTEGGLLDSLLHAVGFNTLVIELLAKNLTVFNKFQTQYSLASLVADLQGKGLFALQTKAVKVVYQSDTLRTETPDSIIAAMYDVSALTDTEKYLLSNFAVLPAENIPYAVFIELLKPKADDDFDTPLSSLQQKGWIEFYDDTATFKISPVIQHITKRKNTDTLLDDCDTLMRTLIDKLHHDNIYEDNYKISTIFSKYAETVIISFGDSNYNIALLCERLGLFYSEIGNLDRALVFYEECNAISKQLCIVQPNNEHYKNELAISYERLGFIQVSLGNLDKALAFHEERNKLATELYLTSPNRKSFINGLATSYQYLGITHSTLGNLDKALIYFEQYNRLEKELYTAYQTNLDYKYGLAISYEKLGHTYALLGNLDKALAFFKKGNVLFEELYTEYPMNMIFKNGLAVSNQYLGNVHSILGNLDIGLFFFEGYNRLKKELYAAYPKNVLYKNGLAVSYYKLGVFSRENFTDTTKACYYFKQAENLWQTLVRDTPRNVQFQKFLEVVQRDLKDLA